MNPVADWLLSFRSRQAFSTMSRSPFYRIALAHLPVHDVEPAVDIGAGGGAFADFVNHTRPYRNLILLEGNRRSVELLRSRHRQVIHYRAPDVLPFDADTVAFVHCSHLIEHLSRRELYALLREIDRVLKPGGILVVSAPLLWGGFYADLTHTRPYDPLVLIGYLSKSTGDRSEEIISTRYTPVNITYRYTIADPGEGLRSSIAGVDLLLYALRRLLHLLRINRYVKNGYTLVLRKD